jgi:hypothetical protein
MSNSTGVVNQKSQDSGHTEPRCVVCDEVLVREKDETCVTCGTLRCCEYHMNKCHDCGEWGCEDSCCIQRTEFKFLCRRCWIKSSERCACEACRVVLGEDGKAWSARGGFSCTNKGCKSTNVCFIRGLCSNCDHHFCLDHISKVESTSGGSAFDAPEKKRLDHISKDDSILRGDASCAPEKEHRVISLCDGCALLIYHVYLSGSI